MRLVSIAFLTLVATLQPAVAHACRVAAWEVRPGETSQSAIMRRDQEHLAPASKANVVLARVLSAERGNSRLHLVFERISAVRGSAPSPRLTAETNNFCFPVYEWRAGELAILYLDPTNLATVSLAVPPRQNIDPLIVRDLRTLADHLRQSPQ